MSTNEQLRDELAFLREVEQDVQRIRSYAGGPGMSSRTAANLLTSLKIKLNDRIIELSEELDHADQ